MVYTPDTAADPYLTPDEFVLLCDPDLAAQALSDSGTKLTLTALKASPALALILLASSGLVESAAVIGRRYGPADLAALVANGGASAALLKKLVADVAVFMCYSRRDGMDPPQNVVFRYQEAEQFLERLRLGSAVFSFAEVAGAGLPQNGRLSPDDVLRRGLLSTRSARLLGDRSNVRNWMT